jgi:hypothetical protein
MRWFFVFLLTVFFTACAPQPGNAPEPTSLASSAAKAQEALIELFASLQAREYTEAIPLYGGSYETLQGYNPDIDATDYAALFARGCEQNGFQCLEVRNATFTGRQGDTYIFQVEFSNSDGSLFVRGPCCGADETEMPPVSQFEYRVARSSQGQFVVLDLPPYVP